MRRISTNACSARNPRCSPTIRTRRKALLLGATPAQQKTPLWQFRAAQVDLAAGRFVGGIDRLSRLLHTDAFKKDAPLRSQAYALQGMLLVRLDRFADAERSYEQAIELLGATTDASSLGRALIGRGAARMAQGRFDDALADLGRARIQLTRAGDRLSVAKVDGNLGILEMQRDHPQQAVAAFEKAERDFQAMGATLELAGVRNMLMTLYLQLLDPAKALAVADRAWAAREHLHDPTVIGHLHLARAEVLATVGRLREARALVEQLPDGLIAGPGDADRLHYVQVELARQTGDLVETARQAETALIDWPGDRNPRLRAWVAYRPPGRGPRRPPARARQRRRARRRSPLRKTRRRDPQPTRRPPRHRRRALPRRRRLRRADRHPRHDRECGHRARALADGRPGRLDEAAASIGRVAPWAEQDFDLSLLQVELYARLHQPRAWQASLEQARRLAGERPIPSALRDVSPGGPLARAAASR
jgi:tetratricopeptide (TPR) repeat protein